MNIFSPIEWFAEWVTTVIFPLDPKTHLAESVNFFIYDSIKIFILLAVIVFFVSILRTYVPPEKIRALLLRQNKYAGNIIASVLGIVTPFCTCSAIPLFLGFVQAGVPLGVTFSFLVASPMINEVALVLLLGMFGWKIAVLYIVSGLIIAVAAGIVIGAMKVETLVSPFVYQQTVLGERAVPRMTRKVRVAYAMDYTLGIIKKVWLYVIIGIGVGAWIHGYVPTDFLARFASHNAWYAVPLAVLIGIPLYANAAGVIPLVGALTEKGVAMGTTLAFMMSVTALSLPEFMILKKVMRLKLIMIFGGIVGIGIIFTGYLFNVFL